MQGQRCGFWGFLSRLYNRSPAPTRLAGCKAASRQWRIAALPLRLHLRTLIGLLSEKQSNLLWIASLIFVVVECLHFKLENRSRQSAGIAEHQPA